MFFKSEDGLHWTCTKLKLKLCPFCGGQARMLPQEGGYSVDCIVCGAMKKVFTKYKLQAAHAWNDRSHYEKLSNEDRLKRT